MRLIQLAAALYGLCLAGTLALPSGPDAGSNSAVVKDKVVNCTSLIGGNNPQVTCPVILTCE